MVKCDWCGEDLKEKRTQSGLFVSDDGKERYGFTCGKHQSNAGNPVFETEIAWDKWAMKHTTLAKRIINRGGPAFQYEYDVMKKKGRAWE